MRKTIATILLVTLAGIYVLSLMAPSVKAQQETTVFTSQLLPSNVVPPVTNDERNAFGAAIVTLNVTRSGGNITAATARFDVSISGLTPTSTIILAHIHEGAAGVNGPVRVDSGIIPASPVPAVNGNVSFTRTDLPVPPAVAAGMIANPAGWYFNVHSALNPGGVVRGQLTLQQVGPQPAAAPTLSEWGAILMFLLFIAICTFFIAGRREVLVAAGLTGLAGPIKAIDWKLLRAVTVLVEVVIALVLAALHSVVTLTDVLGALTSGLIAAFTIHLLIKGANR
jgi:CubicO group peptidase (beta-lactamase class C family)